LSPSAVAWGDRTEKEMRMRTRYLATLGVLASAWWLGLGFADAENLSSKLTDTVSAAVATDSRTTSEPSATAGATEGTEREALTNEARDAADRALETSRDGRK